MLEPWILVLADDLTGALEAGAKFASRGLKTNVTTQQSTSERPKSDVLVIDTETRHVTEAQAYDAVRRTAQEAVDFGPAVIYKKTDSTLRGNIAAEFRALRAACPGRQLVYAPAYAKMGRTVRNGKLYVWGKPLHETEFANDLLNPIQDNDLKALLNDETVLLLDGESSEDLNDALRIITTTHPTPLAAGPGALAGVLAEFYKRKPECPENLPRIRRSLVVNGSLHPASLGQMSQAHSQGCFEQWTRFDDEANGSGLSRARGVGERVSSLLKCSDFDALIIFGGDTAFAIHSALGAPIFESLGEVLPGVPLSRCGSLYWITKAGGFGSPDTLCRIQSLLL